MKSFSIDRDNRTAALAGSRKTENAFHSEAELYKLTADWPVSRLVEIWNSIPGFTAVKKFKDRKTAVARIWKAIQNLEINVAAQGANVVPAETAAIAAPTSAEKATPVKHMAKAGKPERKPPVAAAVARQGSKTAEVLGMLRHPRGATLQQLMHATGWLAHSVRGFISGTLGKKMRLPVISTKGDDGLRRYSLAG
jgi:hypothetical protein